MLQFFADIPTSAAPAAGDQLMSTIFMFGMIFVIFYFLIIRPQQKKYKQHLAMINAIDKGSSVALSSGILGKVTKVEKDGILLVQIAEGVEVKVFANTISSVLEENVKFANDNTKKKK